MATGRRTSPRGRQSQRDEIEAWWALITRILAFLLGVLIAVTQALVASSQPTEVRLALLVLAASLMGPVIAANAARILAAWRGTDGGGEDEGP